MSSSKKWPHWSDLKTPRQVQLYLRSLPYNAEKTGETLRSARKALEKGTAHCYEAAFIAAFLLERYGYPPLVVSMESQDGLDHVLYVFRQKGRWGAIAHSRDEGLHGRPPRYRSLKALVWSYFDPYVDQHGRITGYQLAHLDDTGVDWRGSSQNVWAAEKYLIDLPHRRLPSSKKRYKRILKRYLEKGPLPPRKEWW